MNRNNRFHEWIETHSQLVMPLVLAICCVLTVAIGLGAHGSNPHAAQAADAATEASTDANSPLTLQMDAYPAVNSLFETYYRAMADGDTAAIENISSTLSAQEKIRIEELSKYVDSYTDVTVYTQQGPVDGSYICYVYSRMKFTDHDWEVPGMQTMYVCTKSDGSLYINNDENQDKTVTDYIQNAALKDDVVDLTNSVTAEYNELVSSDQDLPDYLDALSSDIDLSVGQALAQLSVESSTESDTAAEGTGKYVTANDTVNIRKEPDENADVIEVTKVGDRYEYVGDAGNGWTEILCNGENAYVRSEYVSLDE